MCLPSIASPSHRAPCSRAVWALLPLYFATINTSCRSADLLFFAGVGDLSRCEKIVRLMGLDLSDKDCCDYDRRTPLHLSASEGAVKVTAWLVERGAGVNALDRFNRTPLEDVSDSSMACWLGVSLREHGRRLEPGPGLGSCGARLAAARPDRPPPPTLHPCRDRPAVAASPRSSSC